VYVCVCMKGACCFCRLEKRDRGGGGGRRKLTKGKCQKDDSGGGKVKMDEMSAVSLDEKGSGWLRVKIGSRPAA
jgi:hypothetical protein